MSEIQHASQALWQSKDYKNANLIEIYVSSEDLSKLHALFSTLRDAVNEADKENGTYGLVFSIPDTAIDVLGSEIETAKKIVCSLYTNLDENEEGKYFALYLGLDDAEYTTEDLLKGLAEFFNDESLSKAITNKIADLKKGQLAINEWKIRLEI